VSRLRKYVIDFLPFQNLEIDHLETYFIFPLHADERLEKAFYTSIEVIVRWLDGHFQDTLRGHPPALLQKLDWLIRQDMESYRRQQDVIRIRYVGFHC
jgi:hypothetical protein